MILALADQPFLALDGGLATELEFKGADLKSKLWSAKILMENPSLIEQVHFEYLTAGADIITTASYQASIPGFQKFGLSEKESFTLLQNSIDLAISAKEKYLSGLDQPKNILIAVSIGPYGAYLANGAEYSGDYPVQKKELFDFHVSRLQLLLHSKSDLWAFETVPSLAETEVIIEILENVYQKPAWISFSTRNEKEISDGTPIAEVVKLANQSHQIAGVGVNCMPPSRGEQLIKTIRQHTFKPILVYPNSGEDWDAQQKCWTSRSSKEEFLPLVPNWLDAGAQIIGGCCRTRPATIKALKSIIQ